MNDLKGILFLVLLKIISITSTNIDCSGNAFHCVNSTHFLICVDLGSGVSITIDDFIIPCPPATVCERSNRFECEYPKTTTTVYPLGVIGVTKAELTEDRRDGLNTISGYVTESPVTYNTVSTSTVTEEVSTLSNVEIQESVKLQTETNVESASEITTVNYSSATDTSNDVNEITANVKTKTSTHESLFTPNSNFFNVESVVEAVLDKPDNTNIGIKEILNGNLTTDEGNNSSLNNGRFTIKPKLNDQVVSESVNLTVNKQKNDFAIRNNIENNSQQISGINNHKIANDTNITQKAPSITLMEGILRINSNSIQNATNFNQSATFTTATMTIPTETTIVTEIPEYGVDDKARTLINNTETVLVNDITTSHTKTGAYVTENHPLFDQINTLPTEVTDIKESVYQSNRNIQPSLSTERLASNFSGILSTVNSYQSITTTEIPLEITTNAFTTGYQNDNLPIVSYESNTEILLGNEFITTETTYNENTSGISTLASEVTNIEEFVNQSSSNKVTDIYENANDVTTSDQVPTTITTKQSTTNLSSTQNVTNYNQSLSSTTPSTTILMVTNTYLTPHLNNVQKTTIDISNTDTVSTTTEMNTMATEEMHVQHQFKEIYQNVKQNNITAGILHDDMITTEQVPTIIATERIPTQSSNILTVTSYDEHLTTDSQRRIADEFISTTASYTEINLFTEQVNTMHSKNSINDLLKPRIQKNIHNEVYQNAKDKLLSTNEKVNTTTDQGPNISSTQKNYKPNFISTTPLETSTVTFKTEYHDRIETKTDKINKIETTTEPYFTEYKLFTDHVDELSTEPTNIQDVPLNNPNIQKIKTQLNGEYNQDKNINISLQIINDSLLNETNTIKQDAPFPVLIEELLISNDTHTNNGPSVNIMDTLSERPVLPQIRDDIDTKTKTNVLVTTSKGIVTDNILLTDATNTSQIEEPYYYISVENPKIPVNQTNLNNPHDQMTNEKSALITETLVNKTGTNISMISSKFTEYNNSSYYIKQYTTDRDQIVNISAISADPLVITINPIVLQDNYSERMSTQNKLDKDIIESNGTSWTAKESTINETNITVLTTIGTDQVFSPNINKTVNIIYKNQNVSSINNTNISPTNSIHRTALTTREELPEEIITTTETIPVTDKVYIETRLDMYQDILNINPVAQATDLQQFQILQDRVINKKTKDVPTEIKNETSIINIGLNSTVSNSKGLQPEISISFINSTTQHTLQSDDILTLSYIEISTKFMTPSPMEPITSVTTSKLTTDGNVEFVQNSTLTLQSAVAEILNTSISHVDTFTNKIIVDHLDDIEKVTEMNTLEPHTDIIIELITPITLTAEPLEKIVLENRTEHILVYQIVNPPTSNSSSSEANIKNISAKNKSDLGINAIATASIISDSGINIVANVMTAETMIGNSSDIINSTDENIADFQIDSSVGNIGTDKPKGGKYNTTTKNNTSYNEMQNKKILFVNEGTDNSILNRTDTSWVSQTKTNDHNITENVFIGRNDKPPIKELTESSTPRLEGGTQNNIIYSESSLTTQPRLILPLLALDTKSTGSNQTSSNKLYKTSIDIGAFSTSTLEPPEYSNITKNLHTEDNVLISSLNNTKQNAIGLQITNKIQGSENIHTSSHSVIKVNSSESFHNQGDLKEQVRTTNYQNESDIQINEQPNDTIDAIKPKNNITTNVTVTRNVSNKNIVNGFYFSCSNRSRGKYADGNDCRKFYTCIGRPQPLAGTCPPNTVFSEINKQCTRNLSHCVRNNQFRCLLEGRFNDFFSDNVYYICIKNSFNSFTRYKLQCLNGFHLNKDTVKCELNVEESSLSVSENAQKSNDNSELNQNTRQNQEVIKGSFECEIEGTFPYPDDCRKYYLCYKNSKAEYRRMIKQCSSDEVFHSETKKCIESESNG